MKKQITLVTAKWCGPCQILKKQIEKEKLQVETLDFDDDFESVKQFNVKSVPVLIVIDSISFEKINDYEQILNTIKLNSNI